MSEWPSIVSNLYLTIINNMRIKITKPLSFIIKIITVLNQMQWKKFFDTPINSKLRGAGGVESVNYEIRRKLNFWERKYNWNTNFSKFIKLILFSELWKFDVQPSAPSLWLANQCYADSPRMQVTNSRLSYIVFIQSMSCRFVQNAGGQ